MEDDLQIFKFDDLSNHWLDLTQIWKLSLGDYSDVLNALDKLICPNKSL
jgi:hypothetical protein